MLVGRRIGIVTSSSSSAATAFRSPYRLGGILVASRTPATGGRIICIGLCATGQATLLRAIVGLLVSGNTMVAGMGVRRYFGGIALVARGDRR